MTLKTVPVTGTLYNADGTAAANASVVASLTTVDTDGGVIVPGSTTTTSDSNGVFTLNLWPNSRGVNGSQYVVRAQMPGALPGVLLVNLRITVPDSDPTVPIPIATITNRKGPDALSDAKAAMLATQALATQALGVKAAVAYLYPGSFATPPTARPDGSAVQDGDRYVGTDGYEYVHAAGSWGSPVKSVAFLYPGSYAVAPTTRPDGSAIQSGDRYVGTDGNEYVYASSAWSSPAKSAATSRAAIDNRIYPNTYAVAPTTRPDGSAIQNGDVYFGNDGFTYMRAGGSWVNQTQAAANSAAAAQNSATQAQGAQAAAWGTARLYPDTTTAQNDSGLAVGAAFATLSGVSSETAIIWTKGSSTASDTGKRIPSSTVLQMMANGILHEVVSSAGKSIQAVLPDGTQLLARARPRLLEAPSSMQIGGKSVSRVIQDDVQTRLRLANSYYIDRTLAHTEAAYPVTSRVIFSNALDGTSFVNVRMGGFQACADMQTLLAWGFTSETSTDDFGMGSLILKRLTWNKTTRAWALSGFISVGDTNFFEHSTKDPDGGTVQGRWISLSSVLLTIGANRGRVFTIFCWQNTQGTQTRVFTRYSDDNGVTWSTRREITSQFPMTTGESWTILAPGPAPGIQLQNGPNAGRIIYPSWYGAPGYPNNNTNFEQYPQTYRSVLIYTDDQLNFGTGARGPREQMVDSNECAIAEDWAGDILWALRTPTFANSKALLKVKNGGTQLAGDAYAMADANGTPYLTTQVMCGMRQAVADTPMRSSAPKIIVTFPNDSARDKLTCVVSYDGGVTFPVSLLLVAGSSSYSIPAVLDTRTIGVLWEDSAYSQVSVSAFNLTTLLGV